MVELRAGRNKVPKFTQSQSNKSKKKLLEEYPDHEDTPILSSRKAKQQAIEDSDDALIPNKIEVKQSPIIKSIVPGHVFRQVPFKFAPITFAPESERLNDKFFEPNVQNHSLAVFNKDPTTKMIYGISGNPDDSKAKYFAAYLVQQHIKALGSSAVVVWNPIYGGYQNQLMDRSSDSNSPTLIVLTNLTPLSTNLKLEKARDILEKYTDIPRIVVCAGIDPVSFLATQLFVPIHGLAYFSEPLVKQRIEIL